MSVLNKIAFPLLLTSLAVVVMGCGGYKGPPRADCSGVVKYNDAPVEGAKVTMSNSSGIANGVTDAEGKFTMEIVSGGKGYPGAPIGTLKVTISKTEGGNDADALGPPPEDPNDQEAQEAYMKKAMEYQAKKMKEGGDKAPKALLPSKYANPGTTDLTLELTKEGKKDIEFILVD